MCFTWQKMQWVGSAVGVWDLSKQLPCSALTIPAGLDVLRCSACPCLCAWLFQEHCLAFQRTASRWPEGQCSTWASAVPRRAIFSRSATQQGQQEVLRVLGTCSQGGIAAGINPCHWAELLLLPGEPSAPRQAAQPKVRAELRVHPWISVSLQELQH